MTRRQADRIEQLEELLREDQALLVELGHRFDYLRRLELGSELPSELMRLRDRCRARVTDIAHGLVSPPQPAAVGAEPTSEERKR